MEMAWADLDVGEEPGLIVQRENKNIFSSLIHCSETAVPINWQVLDMRYMSYEIKNTFGIYIPYVDIYLYSIKIHANVEIL